METALMDRYPVAYIRRSSADADNPGDVSREAQESAVRELAHRDGHNGNLRVYDDWNRSADEAKEAKRGAFNQMLADIEAGRVSVVYAYALDRLYRSMRTFVRLTDAAKANDVRVVTLREGVLGGDGSPMAQAFAQITAVFSQLELNTAKARAKGALDARRQRGDALGQAPYGYRHAKVDGRLIRVPDPSQPVEPVLAAYRKAGSVLGACRLLEEAAIPAPRGGKRWATSLVTRIIEQHAPDLLPRRSLTGQRTPTKAILAQLLRCPFCPADRPTMLTPNATRGQYYCRHGARDRSVHPRYALTERDVLPWVMAEADRFNPPFDAASMSTEAEARRETLQAKRERWIEQYAEGLIDRAERDRRLAVIDRELGDLDTRTDALAMLPEAVDWDADPAKLNTFLRSIWHYIDLDKRMRPTRAEWIIPEWRAA
jgi:DNA invertase Pin-like site-specific DNA recombinase